MPPVALDLDGTLVSCRERQLRALDLALQAVGATPVSHPEFWERKRQGATTIDALATTGLSPTLASAVGKHWVEIIEDDDLLVYDKVFDGVTQVLVKLKRAQVAVQLVTARRHRDRVVRQVERLGLATLTTALHVVEPTAAVRGKAAVLRSERVVGYIGDTETDAEAAKLAHVPFVGVGTGQRDPGWLAARTNGEVMPDLTAAIASLSIRVAAMPLAQGSRRLG